MSKERAEYAALAQKLESKRRKKLEVISRLQTVVADTDTTLRVLVLELTKECQQNAKYVHLLQDGKEAKEGQSSTLVMNEIQIITQELV